MDKCKKSKQTHAIPAFASMRQEDQELKLLSKFEAAWAVYFFKTKQNKNLKLCLLCPIPIPNLFFFFYLPLYLVNLPEGNGVLLVVSSGS